MEGEESHADGLLLKNGPTKSRSSVGVPAAALAGGSLRGHRPGVRTWASKGSLEKVLVRPGSFREQRDFCCARLRAPCSSVQRCRRFRISCLGFRVRSSSSGRGCSFLSQSSSLAEPGCQFQKVIPQPQTAHCQGSHHRGGPPKIAGPCLQGAVVQAVFFVLLKP